MNLDELRVKLDRIDCEVLKLLNMRMEMVLRTRKLKPAAADPKREEHVLENARRNSDALL